MSDAASDSAEKGPSAPDAFVESDGAETRLPYDKGGVPIYIAIAWVGFIIAYLLGVATLVLPDLRAWMAQ